jgi:transcriptional regulator with XRE-family HTH domain
MNDAVDLSRSIRPTARTALRHADSLPPLTSHPSLETIRLLAMLPTRRTGGPPWPRLLLFEHRSGKEAAQALGVTEATVSRWLTGKRYPAAEALIAIDKLYGVSPRDLDADPVDFAQRLADPERMNYVAIAREAGQMAATRARVDAIRRHQKKRDEKVVPIKKQTKR